MKRDIQIVRLKKVLLIIKALPESNSIREVHKKTNIPESTIQGLLHKPDLIIEALGLTKNPENIKEIEQKIQKWFEKNKKEGPKRGVTILQTMKRNHPTLKRK